MNKRAWKRRSGREGERDLFYHINEIGHCCFKGSKLFAI